MNYRGAIYQSLRNKLKFFRASKLIIWHKKDGEMCGRKYINLEVAHLAGAAVFS